MAVNKPVLALASMALTLAALEGAARMARRAGAKGKEAGTIALYTEHDPLLGWRKRPGAHAVFERREYTVEVAINGQGLRDKEREYRAAPSTFRVLALGDSFVEAYSVPLGASVTQVLEVSLDRPGCRSEVINGGTAAYSTDQEYLFYRQEGARYSPNVVVLFFYFNDVLFNSLPFHFGTPKPRLMDQGGRLVVQNEPVPVPRAAAPRAQPPPAEPRSALFEWVRQRLRRGAPRAYAALARVGLWAVPRVEAPPDELKVFRPRPIPDIETAWDSTAAILEALAREVEARGAHLLVAYVPSRMEVSDQDWELTRLRYGMDESKWDRTLVFRRLAEIGSGSGIPVLDLTGPLRAAQGRWGGPYYVEDGHWNALGHRVAAAEVERALRAAGWLPPCASTR
jgi:acetyltransferase AlgX (SGNH hydrolase-like protein)